MFSDSTSIFIGISLIITVFIAEFKRLESNPYTRLLLLITVSVFTFLLTEWKDYKKDTEQKKEKALSDSLSQVRTDSAVGKAVAAFGKAVGEYNLKVESGFKGVIRLVRDSSKRVIKQANDVEPYFGLCVPDSGTNYKPVSLQKSENFNYQVLMDFCALYASAVDINVRMLGIVKQGNEYSVHIDQTLFNKGFELSANMMKDRGFEFKYLRDDVYFFFYGNYFNATKTKRFKVDELIAFNLKEGRQVGVSWSDDLLIRKQIFEKNKDAKAFFIKNGIKY